MNKEASDGLSTDLTFISPRVPLLRVLDLEDPLVPVRVVDRVVPHVGSVRVAADGQDVQVVVSDPRDLKMQAEKKIKLVESGRFIGVIGFSEEKRSANFLQTRKIHSFLGRFLTDGAK